MNRLIERLQSGERWEGDNSEVLSFLGKGHLDQGMLPLEPLYSVDDALRLVAEGWVSDGVYQSQDGQHWVWPLLNALAHNKDDYQGASVWVTGEAPTAAIALTIAILEASRG